MSRLSSLSPSVSLAWDFCRQSLPHVSRTFALTVPILPSPLSDTVCCAYLLCRVADTIEDREDLSPALRESLYDELSALLRDDGRSGAAFVEQWPPVAEAWLQRLMSGLPTVLMAFRSLSAADREAVGGCVVEMIEGMRRSHRPPDHGVVFVSASLEELERYCHYVAGTVGIMLTGLFNQRLTVDLPRDQGHRFGLGLQLTNILKDHAVDVARGTSFIPRMWLDDGLQLKPEARSRLIDRTLSHLEAAHEYTLAIPAEAEGMRLFCLWALWMAVATVREVGRARVVQPKITRVEVASLVAQSKLQVRDDRRLGETFRRLLLEARQASNGRL